jgi:hypothetical protein
LQIIYSGSALWHFKLSTNTANVLEVKRYSFRRNTCRFSITAEMWVIISQTEQLVATRTAYQRGNLGPHSHKSNTAVLVQVMDFNNHILLTHKFQRKTFAPYCKQYDLQV